MLLGAGDERAAEREHHAERSRKEDYAFVHAFARGSGCRIAARTENPDANRAGGKPPPLLEIVALRVILLHFTEEGCLFSHLFAITHDHDLRVCRIEVAASGG